jgi:soluble lytic murein transglycosylase-like protein
LKRNYLPFYIAVALWFLAICLVIWKYQPTIRAAEPSPEATEPIIQTDAIWEPELIEAALVEQGYFRYDIPLTFEEQDLLQTACEETGIPYALALAVIRQETNFRNVTGDDGRSVGYMQIQERWHKDRMDRLGVADLTDPFGNFRVGCDFLAELARRYDTTTDVLTAYNSGKPGQSAYAESVIQYLVEYEAMLKGGNHDQS